MFHLLFSNKLRLFSFFSSCQQTIQQTWERIYKKLCAFTSSARIIWWHSYIGEKKNLLICFDSFVHGWNYCFWLHCCTRHMVWYKPRNTSKFGFFRSDWCWNYRAVRSSANWPGRQLRAHTHTHKISSCNNQKAPKSREQRRKITINKNSINMQTKCQT